MYQSQTVHENSILNINKSKTWLLLMQLKPCDPFLISINVLYNEKNINIYYDLNKLKKMVAPEKCLISFVGVESS